MTQQHAPWFRRNIYAWSALVLLGVGVFAAPVSALGASYDDIGSAYVLYDGKKFAGGENEDEVLPIASLTKLMTALVLVDVIKKWDRTVTITDEYIRYPKEMIGDAITSEVPLRSGDKMSRTDLLHALLIASSNQSAIALALSNTGLTRKEFVAKMNEKAKALGLKHTKFYDVSGLDERNVSTPKEMAKLAATAFKVPMIAKTSRKEGYTIVAKDAKGKKRKIAVKNRNYSLMAFEPDGVKTGYLEVARSNAVIQKGKKTIVVMHASGIAARNAIVKKLLKVQ